MPRSFHHSYGRHGARNGGRQAPPGARYGTSRRRGPSSRRPGPSSPGPPSCARRRPRTSRPPRPRNRTPSALDLRHLRPDVVPERTAFWKVPELVPPEGMEDPRLAAAVPAGPVDDPVLVLVPRDRLRPDHDADLRVVSPDDPAVPRPGVIFHADPGMRPVVSDPPKIGVQEALVAQADRDPVPVGLVLLHHLPVGDEALLGVVAVGAGVEEVRSMEIVLFDDRDVRLLIGRVPPVLEGSQDPGIGLREEELPEAHLLDAYPGPDRHVLGGRRMPYELRVRHDLPDVDPLELDVAQALPELLHLADLVVVEHDELCMGIEAPGEVEPPLAHGDACGIIVVHDRGDDHLKDSEGSAPVSFQSRSFSGQGAAGISRPLSGQPSIVLTALSSSFALDPTA